MDHDLKWPMLAFMTIAIFGSASAAISSWANAYEAKAAMENGYSQKVEGVNIIWVKDNEDN